MHTTELFLWQRRGDVAAHAQQPSSISIKGSTMRGAVADRQTDQRDRQTDQAKTLISGAALYPLGCKNKKEREADEFSDIASRLCL